MSIHLLFPVRAGVVICKFYGSTVASGLIRVQLFLAVQNRLFCCLILKMGVSYYIILVYYRNNEHTGL